MRSCLIQLLIALAVIFALLWFGLPFGASWLATNGLKAAGFSGTDTKVEVKAGLPPRILLGHADSIRLTANDVSVGDLHAATLDVTLFDVNLLDRSVSSVHGTLTGVRILAPNGDPLTIDTTVIDGNGTGASATMTISTANAEKLAMAQLKAQKQNVTSVKFGAPDVVTITISGHAKAGKLVVKDGAIQMVFTGITPSTVTLIDSGKGNPFRIASATVAEGVMTVVGTIDIQTLLGL